MGRKSHTRELGVWLNGQRAATWRWPAKGHSELQYDPEWLGQAEARPLSLSLPFSLSNEALKGPVVDNYFENLLPDSDAIRQRMRDRFNTPSRNAFDLLAAIGRDCVGAAQLLPPNEHPTGVTGIKARPLDTADVEKLLRGVTATNPLRGLPIEEFRISIAGAQEKTALLKNHGNWSLPLGSTPTTHIFKLPLGLIGGRRADMTLSVENEWLCSRILRAFQIPVAECSIGSFGGIRVLIVERFDRQLHSSGKYWLRLVQEDFCQAFGLPPSQKYEADGGPGILDIAKVLRGSTDRDADLKSFLKAGILFWLLAAGDGHAKNFSIRIQAGGRYQMTPLYDVLSYYPIIGDAPDRISEHDVKMAMAFRGKNKHYLLRRIQRRHMNETIALSGYGESAETLIDEILAQVPDVIETVKRELPMDFPATVAGPILDGLNRAAGKLAGMPKS